jgi:hypothetical protein
MASVRSIDTVLFNVPDLAARRTDPRSERAEQVAAGWGLAMRYDRDAIGPFARLVFTQGQCHGLAAALSELLNAPIIVCNARFHAAVRIGSMVIDIEGITHVREWFRTWSRGRELGDDPAWDRAHLVEYDDPSDAITYCIDWDCPPPDMELAGIYAELLIDQLGLHHHLA